MSKRHPRYRTSLTFTHGMYFRFYLLRPRAEAIIIKAREASFTCNPQDSGCKICSKSSIVVMLFSLASTI